MEGDSSMRTQLLAFGIITLMGCGSGKSSDATLSVNATGVFLGTQTAVQDGIGQYSASLKVILTQVGTSVTGTFENGAGGSGSVVGSITGTTLNLILNSPYPCTGSVVFTAQLNDNILSGSLMWPAMGSCGAGSATFSLNKQ